jgi:hypothetical protein
MRCDRRNESSAAPRCHLRWVHPGLERVDPNMAVNAHDVSRYQLKTMTDYVAKHRHA